MTTNKTKQKEAIKVLIEEHNKQIDEFWIPIYNKVYGESCASKLERLSKALNEEVENGNISKEALEHIKMVKGFTYVEEKQKDGIPFREGGMKN